MGIQLACVVVHEGLSHPAVLTWCCSVCKAVLSRYYVQGCAYLLLHRCSGKLATAGYGFSRVWSLHVAMLAVLEKWLRASALHAALHERMHTMAQQTDGMSRLLAPVCCMLDVRAC